MSKPNDFEAQHSAGNDGGIGTPILEAPASKVSAGTQMPLRIGVEGLEPNAQVEVRLKSSGGVVPNKTTVQTDADGAGFVTETADFSSVPAGDRVRIEAKLPRGTSALDFDIV